MRYHFRIIHSSMGWNNLEIHRSMAHHLTHHVYMQFRYLVYELRITPVNSRTRWREYLDLNPHLVEFVWQVHSDMDQSENRVTRNPLDFFRHCPLNYHSEWWWSRGSHWQTPHHCNQIVTKIPFMIIHPNNPNMNAYIPNMLPYFEVRPT